MTGRTIFLTGCITMAATAAIGAFGAHGLQHHTDAKGLATWETAVKYQAMHGLGLLLLAALQDKVSAGGATLTYFSFVLGILIFSGSLYALVLSGVKWLGAITPIGGLLLIAGWLILAFSYRRLSIPV